MADHPEGDPAPEGVVPPPPHAPADPVLPQIQLAPPLGAAPPPAQPAPPAQPPAAPPFPAPHTAAAYPPAQPHAAAAPSAPHAAAPPYASAPASPHLDASGAYPAASAPYPAASAPASGTPGWVPAVIFSLIGVVLVGAVVGVGFLAAAALSSPSESVGRPSTLPTLTLPPTDRPLPDPTTGGNHPEPSPEPSIEPSEPAPPASGVRADDLEEWLDAKIDHYHQSQDDGSLWTLIPDTEYNRTAVTAFVFLLADMKAATLFGADQALADEYVAETAHLEELLLAQKPLGTDIEITFSKGGFRYDGDTGEGGYYE